MIKKYREKAIKIKYPDSKNNKRPLKKQANIANKQKLQPNIQNPCDQKHKDSAFLNLRPKHKVAKLDPLTTYS